jgi:ABC-2 type transport system permease protein
MLRDSNVLLARRVRLMPRQPIWIANMLVQPLVWLLLYSQLFTRLPQLGGFGTSSYVEYLTPGIAILTAFSHGIWEGTTTVQELENGSFERFFATPIAPTALIVSQLLQAMLTGFGQATIILSAGLALGAHVHTGAPGWCAIVFVTGLTAAAFAGISHALALLLRRQESVIAVGQLAVLPLMFMSAMLTSERLMPDWMRQVAAANPVNWAVQAARGAMLPRADWTSIAGHVGLLVTMGLTAFALAVLALERFERSL